VDFLDSRRKGRSPSSINPAHDIPNSFRRTAQIFQADGIKGPEGSQMHFSGRVPVFAKLPPASIPVPCPAACDRRCLRTADASSDSHVVRYQAVGR
jgi:hypothetical protein